MRIGVPRELKPLEGRVGLIPAACASLIGEGHEIFVESGAGKKTGYHDEQYRKIGATVVADAAEVWERGEMIVKVKEPVDPDLEHLRDDHLLFCYLHLAALPELTQRLCDIGATCVAFETVEDHSLGHHLPLLAPMSDIAGRIAIQVGTHLLHQPQGGKGILLGGVPAAKRGKVVILGGGVAGGNSAVVAAGLGAEVTVFDMDRDKLEQARALGANVTGLYPHIADVEEAVSTADIVVGAVLVTGERAPHVVSKQMIHSMTPGSVVVDISVDQGGCVETTRPTTYADPTYEVDDVIHFCVTNMPGAVPRTASQALSAAIAPYAARLARPGWRDYEPLRCGINVDAGQVVHPALMK
ncbi:MAG: alanine dehydrogenase [Gammaproteobacteria bacterium]|nr:alanine dehydrogenase [Gammaproteobacteria bacterium]NNF62558.1 alanine dehydrogenase [Gammaproteobacteria bacterium]NNM20739.1 alanine dehydrogenase [Gammaproteobacteria bacterium]